MPHTDSTTNDQTMMRMVSCFVAISVLLRAVDGLSFDSWNCPRQLSIITPRNGNSDICSVDRVLAAVNVVVDTPPSPSHSPPSSIRRNIGKAFIISTSLYLAPSSALAGIDVSGLRVEDGSSKANIQNIELAGVTYTPAAMVLQIAEQTASMEGMMKASALEMKTKGKMQRLEAGSKGEGPGVVGRNDLLQSTDVMIKNSKIAAIAPAAAVTLKGVARIVNDGTGDMTKGDYLAVAKQYEAAREDLRRAFESMPQEEQAEGKDVVRRLRAKDEERMQLQRGVS